MGNDIKIKNNYKDLFLNEKEYIPDVKPELYNLSTEFEKTKRNKNMFTKIVIIAFIIVISLVVFAFSRYIDKQDKNVKLDIQEFEDTNLRDILTLAKKSENALEKAKLELEDLISRKNSEITDIKNDILREKEILASQDIDQADKDEQLIQLNEREKLGIKKINGEYNLRIRDKQEEVARLTKEQEILDKKKIDNARNKEDIIDVQTKLAELEKDNLKTFYQGRLKSTINSYNYKLDSQKTYYDRVIRIMEQNHKKEIDKLTLKYNPIYDDKTTVNILNKEILPVTKFNSADPDSVIFKDKLVDAEAAERMKNYAEDNRYLISLLSGNGYINSVPDILKVTDYNSAMLYNNYIDTLKTFVKILDEKDSQLNKLSKNSGKIGGEDSLYKEKADKFASSFENVISVNGAAGIILSADKRSKIGIYLKGELQDKIDSYSFYIKNGDGAEVECKITGNKNGDFTLKLPIAAKLSDIKVFDFVYNK